MEENLNNWLLQKIYYFFYFKLLKFQQNEIKRELEFCGKNVSLELPLVIYGTENVKIFDNVVINSFVHIWGMGGEK